MYATVRVHLVNLFSLRAVTTNAFTARTLLCPAPATIKMGLLGRLIERDGAGATEETIAILAQRHLEWLAPLHVGWLPPPVLAVTAATMSVLKGDSDKKPLTRSVGVREYVHFDRPFQLAIGPVTNDARGDLEDALGRLRSLGVAESLVQPLAPPVWSESEPEGFVWLTRSSEADTHRPGGEACVLDDLGRAPTFERLSVYRPNEAGYVPRLGEDRRRNIVVLPLRAVRQGLDGRVLVHVGDDKMSDEGRKHDSIPS